MRYPLCFLLLASAAMASTHSLISPDGTLRAQIEVADGIRLSIARGESEVLSSCMLDLSFENASVLGEQPRVARSDASSVSQWIEPVVASKFARIHDRYRALELIFESGHMVEFRAYEDGVAYRFVTTAEGSVEVTHERIELRLPPGTDCFFPEEEAIISHNERKYPRLDLAALEAGRFCSLPVLFDPPGTAKVLFTEADLYDYPALYLESGDDSSLHAMHPRFVLETKPAVGAPDRDEVIVAEAAFLAKTEGARTFPWRVFVVSGRDGDLIGSELVYQLSRPLEIEDPSWIRPGRVAWDWYNALNLTGVDFVTGVNTETYRHYIDFAAEYRLEYVILDEGWSISSTQVDEPNADIDLASLVAYGRERGVGLILWSLWGPIAKDRERLFALYEQWGIAGVKIDFMQRSDQTMVNFYTETAQLAAKHHLLLDFHGSFKPAGLRRAYPNVLSYEGVKGNENNKWSQEITPRHNVTIPFTRMVAGPMDYTPGAMRNAHPINHLVSFERPMGIGTRAHEVAKYVVFESPLQMLCDAPSLYRREVETTQFIARIPSTWDDTRVLAASVSEYVLVARRKGTTWYVGGMTNEEPRSFDVDWSFLGEGNWQATMFADGINAERQAEDYRIDIVSLTPTARTRIRLASGGGWSAIVERE